MFAHQMCTIWCKSLSQPLKCNSLTPHEASELAKLQTESYVEVRYITAEISASDSAVTEKLFL